jgi:hypothetical protein
MGDGGVFFVDAATERGYISLGCNAEISKM